MWAVTIVVALMAAACLVAGAVALHAAGSVGAGRPFTRYLTVGLGLLGAGLVGARPLVRVLGRAGLGVVAGAALLWILTSALRARRHARDAPNLLPSARSLSRLGARLVIIGVVLAGAALLAWVQYRVPLLP